jgi:tRNA A37 N6-isopentenylltransferase MiaA
MAGNVLFQNQQSQQGPYRTTTTYGAESPHSGSDQLQFYSSNYNQYGKQQKQFFQTRNADVPSKMPKADTETVCKEQG